MANNRVLARYLWLVTVSNRLLMASYRVLAGYLQGAQ